MKQPPLNEIAENIAVHYCGGNWTLNYTEDQKNFHRKLIKDIVFKALEFPTCAMEDAGEQARSENYCTADIWRFMFLAASED